MFPVGAGLSDDSPEGPSYGGVYVAAGRDDLCTFLARVRFTGFVGPQEGAWVVAVAANPLGTVSAGRRTLADLARDAGTELGAATVAVEMDRERRLRLWAFDGGRPAGHYDSAPPEQDWADVPVDEFGDPLPEALLGAGGGSASADGLVRICATAGSVVAPGAGQASDDDPVEALEDLLDEELTDSVSESERLRSVLRLLGLPTWLIASGSLPRDVPGGPRAEQVLRLRAGRTGAAGLLPGALTSRTRRKPKPDR